MAQAQPRLILDGWFLHEGLLLGLIPEQAAHVRSELQRWQNANVMPMAAASAHVYETALERYAAENPIRELVPALLDGSLSSGELVGHEQAYYFRRSKATPGRVEFDAQLSTDEGVRIEGDFNLDHCTGSTGRDLLSGRRRVFLLGFPTEIAVDMVRIRPLLLGHRFFGTERPPSDVGLGRRVMTENIDEFGGMRGIAIANRSELKALKDVPEQQLKEWFAEIIGEPIIPKDWGGERSDLYTSRIHVSGEPTTAAFLLKGPSFFRPMTIAALGKPGDQIKRLYEEPAELLVLQHCHEIRAPVANMMETFAWDARQPRRYAIIDGYDTLRILRAYKKVL